MKVSRMFKIGEKHELKKFKFLKKKKKEQSRIDLKILKQWRPNVTKETGGIYI